MLYAVSVGKNTFKKSTLKLHLGLGVPFFLGVGLCAWGWVLLAVRPLVEHRGWKRKRSMVGWFTFASMIPFLVASPFGGFLADRIERRKLTIYTQILGVATVACAAALSLIGWLELWHLCVLAFLAGSCRTTQEASIVS